MEFSKQVYWSGLPCPSLGELPDPGIEPGSPALQVDSLPSEPPGKLTSYIPIQNKKNVKKTGSGSLPVPNLYIFTPFCVFFLCQILYLFILCISKLIFVVLVDFTTFVF